jgi:alkanesulfonate monooxygenase SsuD/methylene tetrahydromethanopterin reductase-like flavin-dependent oxidoreductase (luciferase family)
VTGRELEVMAVARHPWVAEADQGVRFGLQLVVGERGLPGLLEAGRRVDALGFDAIYIFDHPALQADPWPCLAALAAVTERVRLGSAVNCLGYRHPAMYARLASDLDHLSGGRLILGLGIGWWESEFRALGGPFPPPKERYAALEEALTIINGAWGPERFTFDGRYYQVEGLRITPPPVQQPPPLLIGGSGEQVTLRLVARYADACNVNENRDFGGGLEAAGPGTEALRRKLDALGHHCAEVGRPYDEVLRTHFTLKLVLAPNEAAIAAKLAAHPPTASSSPATRRAKPSAFVTGTPEQVADHYRARIEAGIQYFVVQLDADDHETIELLASAVMPRLR